MKLTGKLVSAFLLLTFSTSKNFAQLCNGSLGDPVVNITFGSGTGAGAPQNSLTNYNYVAKDCPDDGNYTIGNSTSNCFNASWHTVPQDHTPGDVNGFMMVVNASYTPGDFFVQTVTGLCPNTTYEFAAWIMNVLKSTACNGSGIKPNITFKIETTSGTVLQSYSTGDIPDANSLLWKQYGFFFSTTTQSSVVIRMTNNAPGGCGNDILLDDITFRACGPLVTANISGAADSVDICAGDNSVFTLQANISAGYNDPVYQWQSSTNNGISWTNIAGATNASFIRQPASVGNYLYRFAVSERNNMSVSSCAILSNVVAINVNGSPVISASNKGTCSGDTLSLTATGGLSYSWSGPQNFSSNLQNPFIVNASSANSGTYYIKVVSAKGCSNTDSTKADIIASPVVNAGTDTTVCEGTPVRLNALGSGIITYHWTPAISLSNAAIADPVASPTQTTVYIISVANNKCKASDSVTVTINKKAMADAGPDKAIIYGQSVVLDGVAGGSDITFTWTPAEYITGAQTITPSVHPPVTKEYTLQVISKGCGSASDKVTVKVYKDLFIPNAFTPNNDGINDQWLIETLQAYPTSVVKVYNRYGEMVFNNHGIYTSWDGKYKGAVLSAGAYVYVIDLKNNSPLIKGVVFILR